MSLTERRERDVNDSIDAGMHNERNRDKERRERRRRKTKEELEDGWIQPS